MSEAADIAGGLGADPLNLERLLHFHANEVDNCTDEERPFHDAAVKLLGETMQAMAYAGAQLDADPIGVVCVVDLLLGPNVVRENEMELVLPVLPMPSEVLVWEGKKLAVIGRGHLIEGGVYRCKLLCQEIKPGPGLAAAPASALDALKRNGAGLVNAAGGPLGGR